MNIPGKTTALLAATIVIGACGGGGGGGSSGITYTGKSTPAAISNSNGETLVTESLSGGKIGATVAALQTVSGDNGGIRLLSLYKVLNAAVGRLDPGTSNVGNSFAAAQVNVTDTVQGTCTTNPGSYTYDINLDNATGDFSGTISYSGYCDLGETMNGTTSYSGKYNLSQNDFDTIKISFSNLQDSTVNDSDILTGTVNINLAASPIQVTMNLLDLNERTNEVFKVENFIISDAVATDQSYEDIAMSGRFYVPSEGYVDLTTLQSMRILAADYWPSSGKFKVTGKDNSSATLTALSSTTYQVDVDNNGDAITDYTTTGNWANL